MALNPQLVLLSVAADNYEDRRAPAMFRAAILGVRGLI